MQKETDISTKDWRSQRMAEKVHVLFDRVWTKGEVQLIDDLITDDFVWKVGCLYLCGMHPGGGGGLLQQHDCRMLPVC